MMFITQYEDKNWFTDILEIKTKQKFKTKIYINSNQVTKLFFISI